MKPAPEAAQIADDIRSRLAALPIANTRAIRGVRQQFSRQIKNQSPPIVMQTAMLLLTRKPSALRFVAYELVRYHKPTFESLSIESILKLGAGIDSWSSVDSFAMILSGPTWLYGRIPNNAVYAWVDSEDLWWRRTALVSTVALSRRGLAVDVNRVLNVCSRLATDHEDMVVKALSWALRELSKKHPEQARTFIAKHRKVLSARVIREVQNKLLAGLKAPRGRSNAE